MQLSPLMVPIALFVCIAASAIGIPIARAYARRVERGARDEAMPMELKTRLERMEQALDSIASEGEPLSQAQRFTTQLLGADPQAQSLTPRLP